MAIIKQQIKRSKNSEKIRAANKSFKSSLKTSIKHVLKEVEAGNKEDAISAYNETASKLDSSVTKRIHHKNYASRKKSKLAKLVNSME